MKRPDAATISAQSTCWYRDTVRSCQRMIRLISATQAVRSSRSFHRIASPPSGFSTRAISWKRRVGVEPVERLGDGDDIDRRVRERDRLCGAVHDLGGGDGRTRLLAHALDGFDGGDGRAELDEAPGELAGARGEVADRGPGGDPELGARAWRRPRPDSRAARSRRPRRPPGSRVRRRRRWPWPPRPGPTRRRRRRRRRRRGSGGAAPDPASRPSACGGTSRPPRRAG